MKINYHQHLLENVMLATAIFYKWLAINDAHDIYILDMNIEFCVPNGHCCQCGEDPYNTR